MNCLNTMLKKIEQKLCINELPPPIIDIRDYSIDFVQLGYFANEQERSEFLRWGYKLNLLRPDPPPKEGCPFSIYTLKEKDVKKYLPAFKEWQRQQTL